MTNSRTGSRAEIIAADVAGSHGARPDVVILNESIRVTRREFAENLLDNAAKVPHGLVMVATNAGNLDSWQWEWREAARQSPRWFFHKWDQPAPWLNPADIEEAQRRNGPSRFARLWRGVWSTAGGDALEEKDIQAAVTLPGPIMERHPMEGCVAAWISVSSMTIRRLWWCWWTSTFAAPKWPGCSHGHHHTTGRSILNRFTNRCSGSNDSFVVGCSAYDPFQAEYMAQRARLVGLESHPVPFTGQQLTSMASAFLEMFRSQQIDIYPDPQLVEDLRRLRIEETSYGYRLSAKRDDRGHADRATASA